MPQPPSLPTVLGRKRIYLMRHGHVDYFDPALAAGADPRLAPLTEEGRAQAAAAADALAEAPFDVALHSGLPRAQDTARIVLQAHGGTAAARAEPRLEELRSGKFYTARKAEFAARLRFSLEAAAEPGATFLEGGERFDAAYARAVAAIDAFVREQAWSCALVVAHEGINRLLLGWACGGGLAAVGAFEQDLGCVNVLDFDVVPDDLEQGARLERIIIKAVNVTPYDYLKHGMPRTSLEALFDL